MSTPLLAHHDTPPCPRCKAQAVVPEGTEADLHLRCACCGHDWMEGDPVVIARAWKAQRAWEKYEAESESVKKREKRAK